MLLGCNCSKRFTKKKEKEFFKESYNFLANRYGQNNVISSWVHKDEITPHLHFSFVPVVKDERRGFKVSAKQAITRVDLQTFHNDFFEHLKKTLCCEINVLNEATKEGNRTVEELKRTQSQETLKNATKKMNYINSNIKSLYSTKNDLICKIKALDDIVNIKENKIQDLECIFMDFDQLPKGKKNMLGNLILTPNEYNKLITSAKLAKIYQAQKLDFERQIIKLNKKIPTISEKLEQLEKNKWLDELEKYIKTLPDNLQFKNKIINKNKKIELSC